MLRHGGTDDQTLDTSLGHSISDVTSGTIRGGNHVSETSTAPNALAAESSNSEAQDMCPSSEERNLNTKLHPIDIAFKSAVLSDINSLKQSVSTFQCQLYQLQLCRKGDCGGGNHTTLSTCWLYVRVKHLIYRQQVLESLLPCKILCCSKIRRVGGRAFKVLNLHECPAQSPGIG